MSDQPPHGLELLEWIKVLGGAAATAAGTVWSFLRGARAELQASITMVDVKVDKMNMTQAVHQTDLAVLKANAENHVDRLDEIKDFVKDVNANVKSPSEQLTEVMMEMRKR